MAFGTDWYPVGLSQGFETGTSAPAKLFGAEIVVWRDGNGSAHVWEDRCPHRGMRLSFGFVRGNHIACLYHGWHYDTEGRCRFIPAHPRLDVPDTIRVPRYPSWEGFGMVWAYAAAGANRLDEIPGAPAQPAAPVVAVRSLYVNRPAEALVAHLLEAAAAAWRHDGLPLVDLDLGGRQVHGGIQPIGPAHSALHLVAEAGADRKAIALWAMDLRRDVEAMPARAAPTLDVGTEPLA